MIQRLYMIALISAFFTFLLVFKEAHAITVRYDQSISQNNQVVAEFTVAMKDEKIRTESRMGGMHLVMIKNDQGTFSYRPSQKLAIVVPDNSQPNFTDDIADYGQFLSKNGAVKVGEETYLDYLCEVYTFQEPASQQPAKAWIWKEKQFPIKIEIDAVPTPMLIEFKNVEMNPALKDDFFDLPADTQIFDMDSAQPPEGMSA